MNVLLCAGQTGSREDPPLHETDWDGRESPGPHDHEGESTTPWGCSAVCAWRHMSSPATGAGESSIREASVRARDHPV